jgi:hypothetical protein
MRRSWQTSATKSMRSKGFSRARLAWCLDRLESDKVYKILNWCQILWTAISGLWCLRGLIWSTDPMTWTWGFNSQHLLFVAMPYQLLNHRRIKKRILLSTISWATKGWIPEMVKVISAPHSTSKELLEVSTNMKAHRLSSDLKLR